MAICNFCQEWFFDCDGLFWAHFLAAVAFDAFAVLVGCFFVYDFDGFAFYWAGFYADGTAYAVFFFYDWFFL